MAQIFRFLGDEISFVADTQVSEEELQELTGRLEKKLLPLTAWKSAPTKDKILVNSIKPRPSTNLWINVKTLEEVDQFKYVGYTQTKERKSIR